MMNVFSDEYRLKHFDRSNEILAKAYFEYEYGNESALWLVIDNVKALFVRVFEIIIEVAIALLNTGHALIKRRYSPARDMLLEGFVSVLSLWTVVEIAARLIGRAVFSSLLQGGIALSKGEDELSESLSKIKMLEQEHRLNVANVLRDEIESIRLSTAKGKNESQKIYSLLMACDTFTQKFNIENTEIATQFQEVEITYDFLLEAFSGLKNNLPIDITYENIAYFKSIMNRSIYRIKSEDKETKKAYDIETILKMMKKEFQLHDIVRPHALDKPARDRSAMELSEISDYEAVLDAGENCGVFGEINQGDMEKSRDRDLLSSRY